MGRVGENLQSYKPQMPVPLKLRAIRHPRIGLSVENQPNRFRSADHSASGLQLMIDYICRESKIIRTKTAGKEPGLCRNRQRKVGIGKGNRAVAKLAKGKVGSREDYSLT